MNDPPPGTAAANQLEVRNIARGAGSKWKGWWKEKRANAGMESNFGMLIRSCWEGVDNYKSIVAGRALGWWGIRW